MTAARTVARARPRSGWPRSWRSPWRRVAGETTSASPACCKRGPGNSAAPTVAVARTGRTGPGRRRAV